MRVLLSGRWKSEGFRATITATATFHLINDGASWKLENAGTELSNAIFGTLTASPVPEDSAEDNE